MALSRDAYQLSLKSHYKEHVLAGSLRLRLLVVEAHFQAPSYSVNQLPLARQTSLRHFRPIDGIKFLQKSNYNVRCFRECKLLSDANPRPSIERQIVESGPQFLPTLGNEFSGIGSPHFGFGMHRPELKRFRVSLDVR